MRDPAKEAVGTLGGHESSGKMAASAGARLAGKVCLVTASTAGIGLGIAKRLGREGAAVMVRHLQHCTRVDLTAVDPPTPPPPFGPLSADLLEEGGERGADHQRAAGREN